MSKTTDAILRYNRAQGYESGEPHGWKPETPASDIILDDCIECGGEGCPDCAYRGFVPRLKEDRMEWLVDILKDTNVRQLITSDLRGANIYWDGKTWRLAGTREAKGVKCTEECAMQILNSLVY